MLAIKPIQEKKFQQVFITQCGGQYDLSSFAYIANECTADGEKILYPIGGCQFAIRGEKGEISLLRCLPDIEDEEALIIMMRAATNFLFRCGIRFVNILPDAADAALIRKLGFRSEENGALSLDLLQYYATPCNQREKLNLDN